MLHLVWAALESAELALVRADGEQDGARLGEARQRLALAPRRQPVARVLRCDRFLFRQQ